MRAVFLKESLKWSIPAALASLAIQQQHSGNLNLYVVVITLITFLLQASLRKA